MFRTASTQAFLIGLLTALASFCALKASAAPPDVQPHSVVAQSSRETAATGRRPLGQRIASSNLPITFPSEKSCSEHGCPAPVQEEKPQLVPTPIAEVTSEQAASEEAVAEQVEPENEATEYQASETGVAEQEQTSLKKQSHQHAAVAGRPRKTWPAQRPSQGLLLERVKNALAMKRQPAFVQANPPHPIPKRLPQTAAKAAAPSKASTIAVYPDEIADAPPLAEAAPLAEAPPLAEAEPLAETEPLAEAAPLAETDAEPIADTPAADANEPPSGDAPAEPLAGVPARLEFDVRESRSIVSEGEQVVMRIAVRNVGGEPASAVNATLFFADGMEPVQAIGHSAEVYPGEVRFSTLRAIPPGDSVDLLVTAIGTRPGSVTYRGELAYGQISGRIAREGAVTVRPRKAISE